MTAGKLARKIKYVLLAMLTLLFCLAPAVSASTILFVPDAGRNSGSADVTLAVEKLGSVPLPRGQVAIHGNRAVVSIIPEWQFDRRSVLTGTVLDTRLTSGKSGPQLKGVVLFTGGDWIQFYDDKSATETVITAGSSIEGRISAISESEMLVTTAAGTVISIPLNSVSEILSSRVFVFNIPTAPIPVSLQPDQSVLLPAYKMSLAPTGHPFHLRALKSQVSVMMNDGDMPTSHLVLLGTAVSLANLSQALGPILVPIVAGPPLRRAAFFTEYPFNLINNSSMGGVGFLH